MPAKVRETRSRSCVVLGDSVKADDLQGRLKIGAAGGGAAAEGPPGPVRGWAGAVIQLGRHRFNVTTQPLDLTVVHAGR
jgi:hypothetical protein